MGLDWEANLSLALDFSRLSVGLFPCSVLLDQTVMNQLPGQSECFYCSIVLSGGISLVMKALTLTLN